jgi:hypothetical protein
VDPENASIILSLILHGISPSGQNKWFMMEKAICIYGKYWPII